ncbi:MAG TPA: PSD1 and planctomycete cytochrome C domain-containing protein, partial [Methylomirabilota bacterium]|nr:PSD1 and planctomycete cytochrome C domain-containing protein [Methylomirabilota bacterium]
MKLNWSIVFALLGFAAGNPATPAAAAGSEPVPAGATVDFQRDVQPLLERRCLECHDARKNKGSLRLDRRSAALQGGDSGQPAIVPGQSAASLLIHRVSRVDSDERMPPKGERLSPTEINLLKRWIDQGAPWPESGTTERVHWAYVPPKRPPLPPVKNPRWPRNAIDHFILARLDREGLEPSPEADRAVLLRRVSLDLTGLPPTLEELDAFLADRHEGAYEKVVDRLLASPAHGERWARPWLDLARYADTQGFEKDNRRSMWPYRDWVIDALNRNVPFDQFTIEQLAGDLLPGASQAQLIATGFHRNTMTNTEGGTDNEEFRHEAIVDRVNTTFAVWMGSTFACAQCHNHKYDPFTMREYYRFYAFFNQTEDADYDDERPTMKVPTPEQAKQLTALRAEIRRLEDAFKAAASRDEIAQAQREWESRTRRALTNWETLDPIEFVSEGGATLSKTLSKSILAGGINPSNDTYRITALAPAGRLTGVRLEVLETGETKALGRHEKGGFVLKHLELVVKPPTAPAARPVAFRSVAADSSQKGFDVTNLLSGTGEGWAVAAADPAQRVRRSAYFTLAEPLQLPAATTLTFTLRHSDRHPGANLMRFRLYTTSSDEVGPPASLPAELRSVVLADTAARTDQQAARLREYFQSVAPELAPLREQLAARRKELADLDATIPITSVLRELPADKQRTTHMLVRGNFLNRGEKVTPGTPAVLHPFPAGYPSNRLGMARWLVDTNNPLTARVIMNRFWEQYFGRGLVETVEEFGAQGEPPSHPELLDWLATEFMRVGWDMKAMHKVIVMSATYRQSARVTPELLERDPNNRLLARGPRVRLEAEMIRDQALAVSGLLSRKIGGPSVMPPQPEGFWQVVYSGDK